jgi:hypothetical protein
MIRGKWLFAIGFFVMVGLLGLGLSSIHAQEDEVNPAAAVQASAFQKKGKRTRETEAEGSEAPRRFEGDPIIKSRYEHNGESLEVDPD